MNRRDIITGLAAGTVFTAGNALLWKNAQDTFSPTTNDDPLVDVDPVITVEPTDPVIQLDPPSDREGRALEQTAKVESEQKGPVDDELILEKVRNFENEFADDVYLPEAQVTLLHSVMMRLSRVEKVIGHGHYNVVGFDEAILYARNYPVIGQFTRDELEFVDMVYHRDAKDYGFFGDRVIDQLTYKIPERDIVKIPYSGHYLFKGDPTNHYDKLVKDIGEGVILTSGIRANVKQLHLFLAKCIKANYNMSKASRSLAPPGHSYHGIGDFDVGKIGWGTKNFTDNFASTDEFRRMQDLGYVQIRYTKDNRLGVRFEPWHIKVV